MLVVKNIRASRGVAGDQAGHTLSTRGMNWRGIDILVVFVQIIIIHNCEQGCCQCWQLAEQWACYSSTRLSSPHVNIRTHTWQYY